MLSRLRRRKRGRRAIWQERATTPLRLAGDLDQALLRALRTRGHAAPVEAAMKGLGLAGEYGAVWIALGLAGAATDPPRRARWGAAAFAAPAAIVANFAVKRAVGRQRPVITDHPALARAPSKLSFPSAHATSSVAAAVAYARVEPRAKAPLLALAGLICVGRPYLGMHYPSDVAAGVALGALLGRLAPLPAQEPQPTERAPFAGSRDGSGPAGETEPVAGPAAGAS